MTRRPAPPSPRLAEIYAAALPLFARYGFRAARVEDVAAALGMTKGNLYHYVADKEALYRQTVEWALSAWYESVAASVRSAPSASEAFRLMAARSFAYVAGHADLAAVLEADPTIYSLDPKADRFAAVNRAARDLLAEVVSRGAASGEFRSGLAVGPTVDFLYSVYIAFLIKTYPLRGGRRSAALVEAGIDLAVRGLEARDGNSKLPGGSP